MAEAGPGVGRLEDEASACRYPREARRGPQYATLPIASVVIPVRNNLGYTRTCIEALHRNTPEDLPYELVMVDNCSTDGTDAYLRSVRGRIRVLRNDSNLGFARACNKGAVAALGEFLVFLNNDTIPHEGWLTALLDVGRSDSSIAVVGSKLLYPDGSIQHAGVAFGPALEGLYPFHIYSREPADAPYVNEQRDFQVVTAASMLVRRSVFLEFGGFDEAFINGYEDVDFCLRIRARGYRVVYAPRSVLTHHVSKTSGRFLREEENMKLLNNRWASRILPDYECFFETDRQEVPWEIRAREAWFHFKQAQSYDAQERVAERDASLRASLNRLPGIPGTILKELQSRREIDLTAHILAKALEQVLIWAGTRFCAGKNASDFEALFLLALAGAYYRADRRLASRHYLLKAVLDRPTLLLKSSCVFLVLKATVPPGLISIARAMRRKFWSRFATSRVIQSDRSLTP
jgi:GT2 family glycosyltransferase